MFFGNVFFKTQDYCCATFALHQCIPIELSFFVTEIGLFLPNVSSCGFVRDLGKIGKSSFPKSLTKPQGETLDKKRPITSMFVYPHCKPSVAK